jgi:hypothetical protein
MPVPTIVKTAGFPVALLPKEYAVLISNSVVLPKGFAGMIKSPKNVIMITYGSRKGGIIRLYEMKPEAGIKPEELVKKLAYYGVFKDVSRRPGWTLKAGTVGATVVVPTSESADLVKEVLAELKAK